MTCALRKYLILIYLLLSSGYLLLANGMEVSNVRLVNRDTTANTIWILADIHWNNAWHLDAANAPGNYDAAWVFVKVRANNGASMHLLFELDDIVTPVNAHIEVPPDKVGFFISLNDTTSGNAAFFDIAFRWNYDDYGISDTAEISAKVFAIEMVRIPEGAFVAGTSAGGGEVDPFTPTTINTGLSETIPTGTDGIDGTPSGGFPAGEVAPAYNNFPNGYKSFFCMKYEMSQQQYADFLNDLTPIQASQCFQPLETFDKSPFRYDIHLDSVSGLYVSGNPYVALNVLSYADGAAYADWAGLRPMTELEFEKICRGPESSFPGQFPWGDSTITNLDYTLINEGTLSEQLILLDLSQGNAMYKAVNGVINGPVRCGAFAASSPIANRKITGAAYYGVMEMGGNVLERVISLEFPEGRNYKGSHGDGYLTTDGFHTNADWPSASLPVGSSGRGGKWNVEKDRMLISDRLLIGSHLGSRYHNAGFRFVRTSYE